MPGDKISIMNCRPEVIAFALLMERKLRDNDHKKHWRRCNSRYLRRCLAVELIELDDAPPGEEFTSECVDVANFAMMLADKNDRLT